MEGSENKMLAQEKLVDIDTLDIMDPNPNPEELFLLLEAFSRSDDFEEKEILLPKESMELLLLRFHVEQQRNLRAQQNDVRKPRRQKKERVRRPAEKKKAKQGNPAYRSKPYRSKPYRSKPYRSKPFGTKQKRSAANLKNAKPFFSKKSSFLVSEEMIILFLRGAFLKLEKKAKAKFRIRNYQTFLDAMGEIAIEWIDRSMEK